MKLIKADGIPRQTVLLKENKVTVRADVIPNPDSDKAELRDLATLVLDNGKVTLKVNEHSNVAINPLPLHLVGILYSVK